MIRTFVVGALVLALLSMRPVAGRPAETNHVDLTAGEPSDRAGELTADPVQECNRTVARGYAPYPTGAIQGETAGVSSRRK